MSKDELEAPDVLLLHGMSKDIVGLLQNLIESLGLSARPVLDLPSLSKPQDEKVTHYIQNCRMALILVTFDEKDKTSTKARPNVYDEIARCREYKQLDTIVLQESRGGQYVELPSNVWGQLVTIPFERGEKFHQMIPPLLRELSARSLVRKTSDQTMEAGGIFNRFMEQMDSIWDDQLDPAWWTVHPIDGAAESKVSHTVDKFFQQYHRAIKAVVKDGLRGTPLRVVCDNAIEESWNLASKAWEYVSEAMKAAATSKLRTKGKKAAEISEKLKEGSLEIVKGQRSRTAKDSIEHYKRAASLFKQIL